MALPQLQIKVSNYHGVSFMGSPSSLLREVEYKRDGKATAYFEPLHIQYLPIRNEYIEMIQTQVAETNGELVNLW